MIEGFTEIVVRYAETDQMKFAHHSNYIIWFEYGRIELLNEMGVPYDDLEKQGYLLPVLEVNAQYKRPARFNERLTIKTIIQEKPRAKMRIEYEVQNAQNEVICIGFSLHSFMNRNDRAIKPPKVFMKKIEDKF